MGFLFFIYDIVLFLALLLYLPVYFFRGKTNWPALKQRLGIFDAGIPSCIPALQPGCNAGMQLGSKAGVIWVQAVSVGEVILIERLIERLRAQGNTDFLITATTLAGYELAKKKYGADCDVLFFPGDFSWAVMSFLRRFQPRLFVAVETEIWPQVLYRLDRAGVPAVIVNGRISDSAFKRYIRAAFITRFAFKFFKKVVVQNDEYRRRFMRLGCKPAKIIVAGNLKFEGIVVDPVLLESERRRLSGIVNPGGHGPILFAASTHYPEEKTILRVFCRLSAQFRQLRLVIAPRHVARAAQIAKTIRMQGLNPLMLSEVDGGVLIQETVLIVDSVGHLMSFYALADVCFVGGSLVNYGGHNILEPLYLGKPTVFGPFMQNFKDIEDMVLLNKAGLKVRDEGEFEAVLRKLFTDEYARKELEAASRQVFASQKGSLDKNLAVIEEALGGG